MPEVFAPPGSIQPMDPILCREAFNDPDFVYQVKWDGVRMLAYLADGRVTLINKRRHIRTEQYPELQQLAGLVQESRAVLDGEVVVLKQGKPSFASVLSRDLSRGRQVDHLLRQYPIHYMVFDLLWAGEDLRHLPLTERQAALAQTLVPTETVQAVENFDQGKSLFAAVKGQDMEGIVAKRRLSRYISGQKHRDWFKIKYRRAQYCVVGGYTLRGTRINALLLGVFRNQALMYVGRVGSGLKEAEWMVLTRELTRVEVASSPFANKPPGPGYHFVPPHLVVRVEFAEWTENLTLRSPVITGFSNDPPESCRWE